MNWKDYDPTWLMQVVEEAAPDQEHLRQALKSCRRAAAKTREYIYFMAPDTIEKSGCHLVVETEKGQLIFDLTENGSVVGVELLLYNGPGKWSRQGGCSVEARDPFRAWAGQAL